MRVVIKRYDGNESTTSEYIIANTHTKTTLDIMEYIKENEDNSLSYRCGCKSGICGSCAITINGVERLACKSSLNDKDEIGPLKNTKVIKDLVVELKHEEKLLKKSNSFLESKSNEIITSKDERAIDTQSNCILCQSCFSSCPVYEVNKEFLGPYALTRVFRYINDKKEENIANKLNAIQSDGIWDCTLCGNCTIACPQGIDPKTDIMNLRMKSVQNGFEDKTFQQNSFSNEFDLGFNMNNGFNPNGF